MCRWSLRTLFVVVAICGLASRVAREAALAQEQERVLEKLRGIVPDLRDSRLKCFL
ncbi:MAG TPA: hypothetical protein VFB80_01790 [Pirellulaceae bacterium]|nr:hypothetical protein [Pirellulaceae bacterium]